MLRVITLSYHVTASNADIGSMLIFEIVVVLFHQHNDDWFLLFKSVSIITIVRRFVD